MGNGDIRDLAALADSVDQTARSPAPLDRLAKANEVARGLQAAGDQLLRIYVDLCRATGRTWADVADVLGVTRQRAHQRFGSGPLEQPPDQAPRPFGEWTPGWNPSIAAAVTEARRRRHDSLDTEHLLLGAIDDRTGVAGKALISLGVDLHTVRKEIERRVPNGSGTVKRPPFTEAARKALVHARREAAQMGHDKIGSGHILLGVLLEDEGLAAGVPSLQGVNTEQARRFVELSIAADLAGRGPEAPADSDVGPSTSYQEVVLRRRLRGRPSR